ncbi:aminoglycoside phosphotransferase family protein [Paenisporosarcina quisquiliarum]|uniref:Aminoglycoside phosphotransferase family protein n=1 Tax=Paenisporosarcina quisquiliarum TaxID=365346 RepID=A0A9X3LDI5_9BACL|nr:aminoglycoside phosphotransferase family protein [Paenisporosarcina quisquiliarum]MCZ8536063.1 aminoglycoside phosphotransferase family protein [Paenisporosarcina quisquiliarum]
MVENLLKKHLIAKYGDFTPIRLAGGYTNETFLLVGIHPPVVAKVINSVNDEIENEINCLKLTQETGITPKIYDVMKIDDIQIIVMEYRKGINGQTILDSEDLNIKKELYEILGQTLAKSIHSKKYQYVSSGIKECNFNELNYNLDFVPDVLINNSKFLLKNIQDCQDEWVLTHGDYGVHNILYTDTHTLTVLDWEWSEWANPLTDIGWVCWFTKLHYPQYAESLNQLFINEYKKYSSVAVTPELLKAYCVYKVWKILHRIKSGSHEIQEEWVRRLKWTMEEEIFNFN